MRAASMNHLNDYAEVLKVHPITVLRAVQGKYKVVWHRSLNPKYSLDQVADALRIDTNRLRLLMIGKDRVMKRDEAMQVIGGMIGVRAFDKRRYPVLIRRNNFSRFSYTDFMNYHIQRWLVDENTPRRGRPPKGQARK